MSRQDPKGYYEVLGVSPDASPEEIRRAFRTLAKACHPDHNPHPGAALRFQRLSEAYAVLSAARSQPYGETPDAPGQRSAGGVWPVVLTLAATAVAAIAFVHAQTLAGYGARAKPPPPTPVSTAEDRPSAQTTAPVALCAKLPDDGTLFEGQLGRGPFGHHLEITNGSDGPTIIKLRDAHTGRARLAFFVGRGGHAKVGPLPDGDYHIQYAVGADLAEDCRSFTAIDRAAEFPDPDSLKTEYRDGGVVTRTLSYVLYNAPNGNVRAETIDPQKFLSE